MERCQYGWVEICHLSEPTSDCDVFYLLIPKFWTGTLGMKRSTYRTTCPVQPSQKPQTQKILMLLVIYLLLSVRLHGYEYDLSLVY